MNKRKLMKPFLKSVVPECKITNKPILIEFRIYQVLTVLSDVFKPDYSGYRPVLKACGV
jgi:hypothetical protein